VFGDTLLKNIKVISLAPLVLMILINVPLDSQLWLSKEWIEAGLTGNRAGSIEFASPPKGAHDLEILRVWSALEDEKLKELKDQGLFRKKVVHSW
jgi:hypothetical protein